MTKPELITRLEEIQKEIRQLPRRIEFVTPEENDKIQKELIKLDEVMIQVVRI